MKRGNLIAIASVATVFLLFGNQLSEFWQRFGGGFGGGGAGGAGGGAGGTETGNTGAGNTGRPPYPSAVGRGNRNGNPLNIVISSNAWQGKRPKMLNTDGTFEQFDNRIYGIRAAIKNLRSYFNSGANTIDSIIERWTSGDPDRVGRENYKKYVSRVSGEPRDRPLSWNFENAISMIQPMALWENGLTSGNGSGGITVEDFTTAWNLI